MLDFSCAAFYPTHLNLILIYIRDDDVFKIGIIFLATAKCSMFHFFQFSKTMQANKYVYTAKT